MSWTVMRNCGEWSIYEVKCGSGRYKTEADAIAWVREQQEASLQNVRDCIERERRRIKKYERLLAAPVRGSSEWRGGGDE